MATMRVEESPPGRDLVGREAELAQLEDALAATLRRAGRLVLLTGEAGIGKTRLAEEVVRRASSRGALVTWSTGVGNAAAPPYWPWVRILRRCARELQPDALGGAAVGATDLTDLLPHALLPSPLDRETGDASQLRFRLFDGITTLLSDYAHIRPLVLVLDDVHWIDAPSLLLLEFVATQLRDQGILVLATCRDPDVSADVPADVDLLRLGRLGRTIRIGGLDHASCRSLIEDAARMPVTESVVELVRDRTGGNPFFIGEVVRLLAVQGRLTTLAQTGRDVLPAIPRTVREIIDRRTARLSPECAHLLARASVIGLEIEVLLLAAVADRPTDEVTAVLCAAVHAGVLTVTDPSAARYRFAHPLLREAFYADLPVSQRAALHRRVAERLEAKAEVREEETSVLARHFRLAIPDTGPEKALKYALLAARRAMELLAYEEAAEHLRHALDMQGLVGGRALERAELLLELGEARMRAGDWGGAVDAYAEAAASARRRGDAVQLARAALGLGAGLSGFEVRLGDQRQRDLLEEAAAKLVADSPLRARVLARLSVASTLTRPAVWRADMSRRAMTIARQAGDPLALAYAMSAYCDAISGVEHSEERLNLASEMIDLAAASASRDMELLGRRFKLVALLEQGELAGVDEEIAAFERVAEVLGQPLYRWYVPLWKGMRAVTEGRLADCETFVATARAIGEMAHSRNAEILTLLLHVGRLMESAEAEEACRLLEDFAGDAESGANVALFRVRLRAEAGRRAEARSLLSWLASDGFARVVSEDTAAIHGLMWAADAAVDLRDREAAVALYDRLLPHAHRFGVSGIAVATAGSAARPLGRLAHLLEQWEVADTHFHDAVAAHRRAGATLLLAHTLRHQAAMLFDRSRPSADWADGAAAEAALEEAIVIYRELGLEWRVKQAEEMRSVPEALDADAPRRDNVFRREGEVWSLVYRGKGARVQDVKGLHDLAKMVSEPGREFHVLDLLAATAPAGRPDTRGEGLHEQGHAGELIDAQARRHYRRRIAELDREREEAQAFGDDERSFRLAAERDALIAELARAYGLSGRARTAGDPVERARSAVTWRIRSALKRIEHAHPELGRHLVHSVKTGTFCSYTPEAPTTWMS